MTENNKLILTVAISAVSSCLIIIAFFARGIEGTTLVAILLMLGFCLAYLLTLLDKPNPSDTQEANQVGGANREYLEGLISGLLVKQDKSEILVDTNGVVVAANSGAVKLSQTTRDSLVGRPLESVFSRASDSIQTFLERLRLGDTIESEFLDIQLSDEMVPVVMSTVENQRTGESWLRVTFDKCKSDLDTSEQSVLSGFSLGIAHDLNNILSSLNGAAGMLERLGSDRMSPREIKLIKSIKESAKKGTFLAKDLMEFGISMDHSTQVVPIELAPVISKAIDALAGLEAFERCQVSVSVEENVWAECTENGLYRILMNMLYNSIDAMPNGGDIVVVVTSSPDDTVVIEVSDNGHGMNEAVASKVFDPFFSTKKSSDGVEHLGGSGLGLANARGLIDAWGGEVSVRSAPSEGTTFIIKLRKSRPSVKQLVIH